MISFIQQLFFFVRTLFKKKCPKCGKVLLVYRRVDYVPAYGEDPPYNGTFEVNTLFCPGCLDGCLYSRREEPRILPHIV